MTQNDFNEILLSAVDEGLRSLGGSSKQAILFRLETSFELKEESIPSNLTEFNKALESIFGPGADYLEKIIMNRLQEKLGLGFEEGAGAGFVEYVETARSRATPKRRLP